MGDRSRHRCRGAVRSRMFHAATRGTVETGGQGRVLRRGLSSGRHRWHRSTCGRLERTVIQHGALAASPVSRTDLQPAFALRALYHESRRYRGLTQPRLASTHRTTGDMHMRHPTVGVLHVATRSGSSRTAPITGSRCTPRRQRFRGRPAAPHPAGDARHSARVRYSPKRSSASDSSAAVPLSTEHPGPEQRANSATSNGGFGHRDLDRARGRFSCRITWCRWVSAHGCGCGAETVGWHGPMCDSRLSGDDLLR